MLYATTGVQHAFSLGTRTGVVASSYLRTARAALRFNVTIPPSINDVVVRYYLGKPIQQTGEVASFSARLYGAFNASFNSTIQMTDSSDIWNGVATMRVPPSAKERQLQAEWSSTSGSIVVQAVAVDKVTKNEQQTDEGLPSPSRNCPSGPCGKAKCVRVLNLQAVTLSNM